MTEVNDRRIQKRGKYAGTCARSRCSIENMLVPAARIRSRMGNYLKGIGGVGRRKKDRKKDWHGFDNELTKGEVALNLSSLTVSRYPSENQFLRRLGRIKLIIYFYELPVVPTLCSFVVKSLD